MGEDFCNSETLNANSAYSLIDQSIHREQIDSNTTLYEI